ncbi:MAG: 1-acyl-sn-glycerol-3-phosphate acyltransferase [Pseudomonadales bacterium]
MSALPQTAANSMFDEIRPYRDDEAFDVLQRTIRDPELLGAVRSLLLPAWSQPLATVLDPLLGLYLRWQARKVHSISDLQAVMEKYLVHALDTTTAGFTVSGLQYVPRDQACLFIGNHRDIALDPAFMSLSLHRCGLNTCRIAIGDNLLSKPFVADLLRLNKCFIVNRSASGNRQLLKTYQQLSQFIEHSIVTESTSVWLAQREGRAKDCDDRTEPAILKMLHMSGKKNGRSLAEHLATLRVIPVSISYELDPCDVMKAEELLAVKNGTKYAKAEHEDVSSIGKGVSGEKGRVHLAFCPPLSGASESAEQVAKEIDASLHRYYQLQPSNLLAFEQQGQTAPQWLQEQVYGKTVNPQWLASRRDKFMQRIQQLSPDKRDMIVQMYAQPVLNRLALECPQSV